MAQSDHALLAPSSAARTHQCPGSVRMAQQFPKPPTPESMEGDAAHWVAAQMVAGVAVNANDVAPNGIVVNDDMLEGGELWMNHINGRNHPLTGDIETRLPPSQYLHPDNWGTPDHATIAPGIIYIDDYKYGHKYIDVFRNWQLMNYAELYLSHLGVNGDRDQYIDVCMTIVQPRCYHKDGPIRSWTIKACELRPYVNILRSKFEEALSPNPPCYTGPECEYCPARHACPALAASASNAMQMAYESTPLTMTPQAIGLEIRMLRRAQGQLKARLTGLEEQALSLMTKGAHVPYCRLDRGQARTIWKNPQEARYMAELMGVKIDKPDVMTPKQAIKAGLDPDIVAVYSITPPGTVSLESDDGTYAAKIFTKG